MFGAECESKRAENLNPPGVMADICRQFRDLCQDWCRWRES